MQAKSLSARSRSRVLAMLGIYQHLLTGNLNAEIIHASLFENEHISKCDLSFFRDLLSNSIAQRQVLEGHFSVFLEREPGLLSPVEHAILLLATYEITQCLETPYRVVINEAVELAKAYGGMDGHKFVNGVLDKLANNFRKLEVIHH